MPDAERSLFRMMPVSFTNELLGPAWDTKMAQRRDARFINSAMMATLGGALVSDGLADGRVVSGVGGQYNFVAQAPRAAGRTIDHRGARDAREWQRTRIQHPLELRPRDNPAPPAGRRADRVRYRRDSRQERCRSGGRYAGHCRFAIPARAARRGAARRKTACESSHRGREPAQSAGSARAGIDAASRGGAFQRPALRHRPEPRGSQARAGAAWPEVALGNLGGKLGIAASFARPLPHDAAATSLFERMGVAKPRGFRERLMRRLVAAAIR